LTLAGPRLRSRYPGDGGRDRTLQTETETLTDLIRVRGLWFYLVRCWLFLNRVRVGHIPTEFLPERLCFIRSCYRTQQTAR